MNEVILRMILELILVLGFGSFSYVGFYHPEIFDTPTKGGIWKRFIADNPEKRAKRLRSYRRSAIYNLLAALLIFAFFLRDIYLLVQRGHNLVSG